MTEKTVSLVAVKVISPGNDQATKLETVSNHLKNNIVGESIIVDDNSLLELCDLTKTRQSYKIPNPASSRKATETLNGSTPNPTEIKSLERIILGVMAIKGA